MTVLNWITEIFITTGHSITGIKNVKHSKICSLNIVKNSKNRIWIFVLFKKKYDMNNEHA